MVFVQGGASMDKVQDGPEPTYYIYLGIQHAPYCHMWSFWLYRIFPRYLINDTFFEKKLLNIKFVF